MFQSRLVVRPRHGCLAVLWCAAAIALSVLSPAQARINTRLCFPSTTWFGGGAPAIDGVTITDPGWRGATRYIFDNRTNGTPQPNVTVQGIKDAGNLYLSFEVHKAEQFNDSDMIVLAFDPTGNAADRRRLHIYPVTTGQGSAANVPPRQIDFWVNSATWQGSPAPLPSWLTPLNGQTNLRVTTQVSATDNVYVVELKIPLTGADSFPLPANGDFGMYLNAIRIISNGTLAAEDSWPAEAPQIGVDINNTPDPNNWGNGALAGASCSGVSIASSDITANGGTTQLKFPPDANTFSVLVHNNTLNSSGTPVLAPRIQPTFFIANFGLPAASQWQQIPTGNNPSPAADIAANSSRTYQTQPWVISDPTQLANFHNNPHQCVMVELSASPPSTDPPCNVGNPPAECLRASIVNNAAVQNMNFGTIQPHQRFQGFLAEIALKNLQVVGNAREHVVNLQVRTKAFTLTQRELTVTHMFSAERAVLERTAPSATRIPAIEAAPAVRVAPGVRQPATGVTGATPGERPSAIASSGLLLTIDGFAHSGRFINIRGRRFEIATNLGSFGYSLRYASRQRPNWQFALAGEKETRVEPLQAVTSFRLTIPAGSNGFVNMAFAADPQARLNAPVVKAPLMHAEEKARLMEILR